MTLEDAVDALDDELIGSDLENEWRIVRGEFVELLNKRKIVPVNPDRDLLNKVIDRVAGLESAIYGQILPWISMQEGKP